MAEDMAKTCADARTGAVSKEISHISLILIVLE